MLRVMNIAVITFYGPLDKTIVHCAFKLVYSKLRDVGSDDHIAHFSQCFIYST